MNKFDPKYDGVDHLNIYSKANTWLGRELSNFAKYDLVLPEGEFKSIEGYWFYLSNPDERLKTLYGFSAKKLGESLERISVLTENEFRNKIKYAIDYKILNNHSLLEGLQKCKLPLQHYYYYGTIEKPKVVDAGYKWIIEYIETYKDYKIE